MNGISSKPKQATAAHRREGMNGIECIGFHSFTYSCECGFNNMVPPQPLSHCSKGLVMMTLSEAGSFTVFLLFVSQSLNKVGVTP